MHGAEYRAALDPGELGFVHTPVELRDTQEARDSQLLNEILYKDSQYTCAPPEQGLTDTSITAGARFAEQGSRCLCSLAQAAFACGLLCPQLVQLRS